MDDKIYFLKNIALKSVRKSTKRITSKLQMSVCPPTGVGTEREQNRLMCNESGKHMVDHLESTDTDFFTQKIDEVSMRNVLAGEYSQDWWKFGDAAPCLGNSIAAALRIRQNEQSVISNPSLVMAIRFARCAKALANE